MACTKLGELTRIRKNYCKFRQTLTGRVINTIRIALNITYITNS
jgi:hypothetical protein